MGLQSEAMGRQTRDKAVAIAGLLFLLLTGSVLGCSPFRSSRVSTILPGETAHFVSVLPDRRRILHAGPSHPISLLDVSTGQDVPIPENVGAFPLDDELLYGWSEKWELYVVNLQPLTAVKLEPLPGGLDALPGRAHETDSIYAIETGTDKYMLLLLERDLAGIVTAGYSVGVTGNLDTLLAGVPYKLPPSLYPYCPPHEKVPSPDGQYYYVNVPGLQIFSRQGELLNSISASSGASLYCYGWAWDSSGVYVQEIRVGMFLLPDIGPLQLLLAKP